MSQFADGARVKPYPAGRPASQIQHTVCQASPLKLYDLFLPSFQGPCAQVRGPYYPVGCEDYFCSNSYIHRDWNAFPTELSTEFGLRPQDLPPVHIENIFVH